MCIKDVKIKKGMTRHEVNKLISEWILLGDDIYQGNKYKHSWKCKCGGTFYRTWDKIKGKIDLLCKECKTNKQSKKYKYEVEKDNEYEYIRYYKKGEILLSGKIATVPYIQIKHIYCGNIYEVRAGQFINSNNRCSKCCQKYENSFAHYIEVELGEPLEKYWDFDKNTVNPYHIRKGTDKKIWIKCQKKNYHGSYEVSCVKFISNRRCPYCKGNKTHPKDSFAKYHIDNTDPNFLEKYWDYEKNNMSPWEIARMSDKKVWIKCQNEEVNKLNGLMKKDYHGSYEISCSNFNISKRCSHCATRPNKVHIYDSFGYHHFDKAMNWHPDNEISPFKVALNSNLIYKFICDECFTIWLSSPNRMIRGCWCPTCSSSKGEKIVKQWLDQNNIKYVHDEPYFQDLLSDKGNPLRPDFILPDYKIWIEYDGEFHYNKVYDTDGHEIIKEHDKRKDEYAKKHGWKLIRIPYLEFDNIENILNKEVSYN